MAGNQRVIYSIVAVGAATLGSNTFNPIHGVQSCPINVNFNLEDVFELGQSNAYQIVEEIPDVQATITRVLDGYSLATHIVTTGATSGSIQGRGNVRCSLAMSIFQDTQENASGTPVIQTVCSGMYWNGTTITIPSEGNCTEEVTLVGNNKITLAGPVFTFGGATLNSVFDGDDSPSYGSVMRRQHVDFNNGNTLLPIALPGISPSGTNNAFVDGNFPCSVQNISVSFDLGRESINELGHKNPYFRSISPQIDVTTTIDIVSKSGDMISATEAGVLGNGNNLRDERIKVRLLDSTTIDCGTKNKLVGTSVSDADTGGSYGKVQYTFRNKNYCVISHSGDTSGL